MEFINPRGWKRAPGWSHAIKEQLGDSTLIKISGQVGWDMTQQRVVSDDLVEQYDQALKNICTILTEAGATPNSIIEMRIYVTDVDEWNLRAKEVGKSYLTSIGKHFPAMTLVGVTALFVNEVKVEIEATAVLN
jgi:enamine deaminase RidA (YjgF/YER057c/UK114 family)